MIADGWHLLVDPPNGARSSIELDIDNDSLLFQNRDGLYSSGVQLVGERRVRQLDRLVTSGVRFGQELYTPSDIKLPPALVGPPDHPYAGWIYFGAYTSVDTSAGNHRSVGIDVGCLGPCAVGEWTQTHLHRLINQPEPKGWSRQVRNEFGAVVYGDYAPVRWPLQSWIDLTPRLHGRFGNIHTDAGIDATLRAGRLNALPDANALYAFARIDGLAVAYDATLQGGYFSDDNPHTVSPRRFVPEAELGIRWRTDAVRFDVSVVRRGNEIRQLARSQGEQSFARLQLAVDF